ncbi:Conserved_hypothetical protein [Hexamita inflata]|uniref:Uncharacterized protein n=1 Tax=Hexamita inflata TaxID=28002 RepID=A0AA86QC48_9EUKA|nr:Conserved hypothetical protein [Hexamita inflata]
MMSDDEPIPEQQLQHSITVEQTAVLHDIIKKKFNIQILNKEQSKYHKVNSQFYDIMKLQPLLVRNGTISQLIQRNISLTQKFTENPKNQNQNKLYNNGESKDDTNECKQHKTFSIISNDDPLHLILYLKEPYCFVWSVVLRLQQDKYNITYPPSTIRVILSQNTSLQDASYISQPFKVQNTTDPQHFPIDRHAPCVRYAHIIFSGFQQQNIVSLEKIISLTDFYVEGVVLNFLAQTAMKSRNCSRVYYQISREALYTTKCNQNCQSTCDKSVLQKSKHEAVGDWIKELTVRPAVTTISSLEKILDNVYLVALQHEGRKHKDTYCEGEMVRSMTSKEWAYKWM